jgi:hypothetical protein
MKKYIPIIALVIIVIALCVIINKQQETNDKLIEAVLKNADTESKKTPPSFNKEDFFKINLN